MKQILHVMKKLDFKKILLFRNTSFAFRSVESLIAKMFLAIKVYTNNGIKPTNIDAIILVYIHTHKFCHYIVAQVRMV